MNSQSAARLYAAPPSEDDEAVDLEASHEAPDAAPAERPLGRALLRGWRRRCPQCGTGPMLKSYLKVREDCPVCAEPLGRRYRADDGPAYLTIFVVGHLMAPIIIHVYSTYRPEPLVLASVLTVGCVALSLFLLPRLKGAMLGFMWAKDLGAGR